MISTSKKWGYGNLAVTVISLTSMTGIFFIRFLTNKSSKGSASGLTRLNKNFEYLKVFMFSLGSGVLFSDAFLHLIPHGIGLHLHGGEGHSEEEGDHGEEDDHGEDDDHGEEDEDDHASGSGEDDHDDEHTESSLISSIPHERRLQVVNDVTYNLTWDSILKSESGHHTPSFSMIEGSAVDDDHYRIGSPSDDHGDDEEDGHGNEPRISDFIWKMNVLREVHF